MTAMLRLAMVSRGKPEPRWALVVKILALPARLCTGVRHRKESCVRTVKVDQAMIFRTPGQQQSEESRIRLAGARGYFRFGTVLSFTDRPDSAQAV